MPSIAKRKQRKQQSAILRQARLNLLAEIESLKEVLCDKCKAVGSNKKGTLYTCACPAANAREKLARSY